MASFFNTLLGVWISWWNTLPRVWSITSHTEIFEGIATCLRRYSYRYFIKQIANGFPWRILLSKHLGCFSTFVKLKNTYPTAHVFFTFFKNLTTSHMFGSAWKTIWYSFNDVLVMCQQTQYIGFLPKYLKWCFKM